VLLEKLNSGFVLFETPSGLVAVELSFWQRLYLLWTFRNFRRLSLRLLNSRQAALVNAVANNPSTVAPHYDPSLVIGIVENFSLPLVKKEAPQSAEIAVAAPLQVQQPSREEMPALEAETLETRGPFRPRIIWPTLSRSNLATAAGLLLLCIGSIIAWHRIDAVAGSEAHNRTHPIEATTSSNFPQVREASAVAGSSAFPAALSRKTTSREFAGLVNTRMEAPELMKPASPVAAISRGHGLKNPDSTPMLAPQNEIQASRPPLRSVYPDYSGLEARGVVALTAEVDSEGVVRSVRVVRGSRALAAPAVRAIRQWRYSPYLKNGQSVPTETNVVISVFSDDAISMSFPPSIPGAH